MPRSKVNTSGPGKIRKLSDEEVAEWFTNLERVLATKRPMVKIWGEADGAAEDGSATGDVAVAV